MLIVSEPPDTTESANRWSRQGLMALGLDLEFAEARSYHYSQLAKIGPCGSEYPRRVGVPEKRPLF